MFEVSDALWKQLEPVLNPFKRTRSGGSKPLPFRVSERKNRVQMRTKNAPLDGGGASEPWLG
ncbi:MAG: hypothetical protein FD149_345 [Rhodospirillaceae bacterium]|nr:MAG: hypothetical protein FD149_345 [Rhodospirillaceae bacterium]